MQIEVHLYATLREYAPPQSQRGVFEATLTPDATVQELLNSLGIAAKKVHMVMVNGVGVSPEAVLRENDRVGLFPPVGGG